MAAPQRPGEITYYEELGVENTSSAAEIRDAFRALARLLHPDAQTDPPLKDMAERQMRKLNRVYAVLSDPARRSAYDQSLTSSRNAPIIVFSGSDGNLKKLLVRAGAAMAIILGTFLLIWFAIDTNNSNEVRGQESHNGTSGRSGDLTYGDAGDQIAHLNSKIRTLETERNSALTQLSRMGGKLPEISTEGKASVAKETSPSAATTLAELPAATTSSDAPATPGGADNVQSVPASRFSGFWVYSKAAGSASPRSGAPYRPELIEVTVTEQNGILHGQYHSRYQVLDHAVSPDVDFVFTGTPTGSVLNCAWQGTGGSKGRLTLTLLPANTGELAWNAIEPGSRQWLMSGTATLTKK